MMDSPLLTEEEYASLDEYYTSLKNKYEIKRREHRLLDRVIECKDTFKAMTSELDSHFFEYMGLRGTREADAARISGRIVELNAALDDVFGVGTRIERGVVDDVLLGKGRSNHSDFLRRHSVEDLLLRMRAAAAFVDGEIRYAYALEDFLRNPGVFAGTYGRMNKKNRAYIDIMLHRMLGCGMLPMDEQELESALANPDAMKLFDIYVEHVLAWVRGEDADEVLLRSIESCAGSAFNEECSLREDVLADYHLHLMMDRPFNYWSYAVLREAVQNYLTHE